MSIIKFERQNELIILWTNGLNKIKIVNLFFGISFLILILQLTLATFITPNALNKSRSLVRLSSLESITSAVKPNDFSYTFIDIKIFNLFVIIFNLNSLTFLFINHIFT